MVDHQVHPKFNKIYKSHNKDNLEYYLGMIVRFVQKDGTYGQWMWCGVRNYVIPIPVDPNFHQSKDRVTEFFNTYELNNSWDKPKVYEGEVTQQQLMEKYYEIDRVDKELV